MINVGRTENRENYNGRRIEGRLEMSCIGTFPTGNDFIYFERGTIRKLSNKLIKHNKHYGHSTG